MNLTETTSHIGERLSDAKEEVKGLGRTAGEKLDEAWHWTAGEVHTAASSVRTAGQRGSEAIDGLTSATADKLDSTAEARVENKFFRYKSVLGGGLKASNSKAQSREAAIWCHVLNRMAGLGRPQSYAVVS